MEDIKLEDLTIQFETRGSDVLMRWTGKSQYYEALKILNPFLNKRIKELIGKNLTISFKELAFMNSATIHVIIELIKILEKNNIKTVIDYDESLEWQRLSFKAVKAIIKKSNNISMR